MNVSMVCTCVYTNSHICGNVCVCASACANVCTLWRPEGNLRSLPQLFTTSYTEAESNFTEENFSKGNELKMINTALVLGLVLESTSSHVILSFTSMFTLFKMHHGSAHLCRF